MTWLLGLLAFASLMVVAEVLRRQIKSDREFREWIEKQ